MDLYVPEEMGDSLRLQLVLGSKGEAFPAPALGLKTGWNKLSIDLGGSWLPTRARAATDQVQWVVSSRKKGAAGWVVFDNFRAEAR